MKAVFELVAINPVLQHSRSNSMRLLRWIDDLWCEIIHPPPRWPISGFSECPACLRKRPVAWDTRHDR
jgi:hypothetical protein